MRFRFSWLASSEKSPSEASFRLWVPSSGPCPGTSSTLRLPRALAGSEKRRAQLLYVRPPSSVARSCHCTWSLTRGLDTALPPSGWRRSFLLPGPSAGLAIVPRPHPGTPPKSQSLSRVTHLSLGFKDLSLKTTQKRGGLGERQG